MHDKHAVPQKYLRGNRFFINYVNLITGRYKDALIRKRWLLGQLYIIATTGKIVWKIIIEEIVPRMNTLPGYIQFMTRDGCYLEFLVLSW